MLGMIDCHNHLALDTRLTNYLQRMNDCECDQTIRGVKTMNDDLLSGVTTSRCCGDHFYIDVVLKKAQQEGRVLCPRLVVSGIGMRSVYGHGFVGMPFWGEQDFRLQSRKNILQGVDFLKVFMTKVINAIDFIYHFLTLKVLQAVTEEAGSVVIKTACHCSGGVGLDLCVDAGISVLEHVYYIIEKQVERVVNTGTQVTFTPSYALNDKLLFAFSPLNKEKSLIEKEKIVNCLSNAIKAKPVFGIGTDGIHEGLAQEAVYIASLGASNRDVLKGITSTAATICAKSNVGSIDVGCYADFITVSSNPLDNVKF